MPERRLRQLAFVALATLCLVGAPQAVTAQPSLADWDLICFCNSRVNTPHFIVKMERNGAILHAARNGTTRTHLMSGGVGASNTAIQLLLDWGLLTQRGDTLRTAFPVLDSDRMTTLRRDLSELADVMLPILRSQVDSITAALAARGTPESVYATIFSYVLDGLVWEVFGDAADVPAGIDVEHPFWNGAFWAVNPKRSNAPGTNSYRAESVSIRVMWTESTLDLLRPLQLPANRTALARALRSGNSNDLPESLRSYALFRSDGSPAFAVVDNHLARMSRGLAQQVADGVRQWLRGVDLRERLDTQDTRLALLVTYHEFMWELLSALETSGAITRPPILRLTPQAQLVAPLITVLRESR